MSDEGSGGKLRLDPTTRAAYILAIVDPEERLRAVSRALEEQDRLREALAKKEAEVALLEHLSEKLDEARDHLVSEVQLLESDEALHKLQRDNDRKHNHIVDLEAVIDNWIDATGCSSAPHARREMKRLRQIEEGALKSKTGDGHE